MDDLAADHPEFVVIGVALDESADDVLPFTEGISFPILLDREHVLSELYAVSNVPTVIWVDEHDRIAVPNSVQFGTDTFVDFSGIPAGPHLDAVQRWVRTGELPPVPDDDPVGDLDADELAARLHFRVATHLRRGGDEDGATHHFARALDLAPVDFTIARAQMPLTGRDPFGAGFFELYQQWQDAGAPYHGIVPPRQT
jgi:hypothetical protein